MSAQQRSGSERFMAQSICSVLSCTSDQYFKAFDDENLSTEVLVEDIIISVINRHRNLLRDVHPNYKLDLVLEGILTYAPTREGQRYAAVALHIARGKSIQAVVDLGYAWLESLILPVLVAGRKPRPEPGSSQTQIILDATIQEIEESDRPVQEKLRDVVSLRENYKSAITGIYDFARAKRLAKEGRHAEVPAVSQLPMEVAHIIPLSLNDFEGSETRDTALTWDTLHAWTSLDFRDLAGDLLNSPKNCVYMTDHEHHEFGRFNFYLSVSDGTQNQYHVHHTRNAHHQHIFIFLNGMVSPSVKFPTKDECGVDPPDPDLLEVHAAFVKVSHMCGAAEYLDHVEQEAKEALTLRADGSTDFGTLLMSRLPAVIERLPINLV